MTEAGDTTAAALELSPDEATAVAEAVAAFAAALPPGRDAPYQELIASARAGAVPEDKTDALERVCTLALVTGKARQVGRAEAERLLVGVLHRTPRGKAMAEQVSGVNRALAQLAGRELASARVSQRLPGHFDLSLSVTGVSLTLEITPDGIAVRSLNAG